MRISITKWLLAGLLGLAIATGGCASAPEPFDYQQENELKPGPGLFSGDDGEFTLFEHRRTQKENPSE
jgi:hypothetical protein